MLAVIVAGCSNGPAGTGSSNSTAAAHEKAVKFAECMRANGVSAFPDPDACGTLTVAWHCEPYERASATRPAHPHG